ncbi:hypothetical protein BC374_17580 [Ensifer sp. LC13]|nr:hypothetical protein BC362_10385 [Ensifer sp. LC14]OCP10881.1 hypothetical protein BC374_17580 [Ensifer sp. LC13]OCP11573.1 hypothetical protein BBX50_18275 [Ensifer sp. LC11]OCP33392.1 hypothetical protein BC364_17165 [Ensifer sp. LC499]
MSAQPLQKAAEEPIAVSEVPEELVDAVLEHYEGDVRTAIRELLADAAFLRGELYTANCLMGRGIGRGWQPRYERS